MEIKDKIRIGREEKGWSQERLADELRLSKQTIVNWEKGVDNPLVKRWPTIEKLLNIKLAAPATADMGELAQRPEYMQIALDVIALPKTEWDALAIVISRMRKNVAAETPAPAFPKSGSASIRNTLPTSASSSGSGKPSAAKKKKQTP